MTTIPTIFFLMLWNFAQLQGLATWYGPPQFNEGDIMRNGEGLDLSAPTVAVDASHADWLDRTAVILTKCGGIHFAKITDTGNLYQAGCFRLGMSKATKQLRYWPVWDATPVLTNTIEWKEDKIHRVVADFPRDFFLDRVACDGNETVEARIYVQP